jgi:hypothetical protein
MTLDMEASVIDDPFATFSEWSSKADCEAYATLAITPFALEGEGCTEAAPKKDG